MLESSIEFLSSLPWHMVLLAAIVFTIIENIFPPSPSDSIIVFTGTLVSLNVVGFIPLLIAATTGSIIGFIIMFYSGRFIGNRVIKSEKFPFINKHRLKKPNEWLNKYGYYVILINRFLSGTRAVISFLAGMSKMSAMKSIILAGLSSAVWNSILIYLGVILGDNWRVAVEYMKMYGKIIFPAIAVILIIALIAYFIRRKKKAML